MTAPVGEVTTPITRGRYGSLRLWPASKAFRGEGPATFVEQSHEGALARQLHPLDHDLVF